MESKVEMLREEDNCRTVDQESDEEADPAVNAELDGDIDSGRL